MDPNQEPNREATASDINSISPGPLQPIVVQSKTATSFSNTASNKKRFSALRIFFLVIGLFVFVGLCIVVSLIFIVKNVSTSCVKYPDLSKAIIDNQSPQISAISVNCIDISNYNETATYKVNDTLSNLNNVAIASVNKTLKTHLSVGNSNPSMDTSYDNKSGNGPYTSNGIEIVLSNNYDIKYRFAKPIKCSGVGASQLCNLLNPTPCVPPAGETSCSAPGVTLDQLMKAGLSNESINQLSIDWSNGGGN